MRVGWLTGLLAIALFGCGPADQTASIPEGEGPGSTPWHDGTDVTCATVDDCGAGEACDGGVCVMARCVETYESLAPLGKSHFFGTDAEVTVISDETWVDAFEASDGAYLSSWDLSGGGRVLDVAGGNLVGERPQTIAVAIEQSNVVRLQGPAPAAELDVGIWPQVLAAGDVDGDGLDEIVAFGQGGAISLCHVDEMSCEGAMLDGATANDVAVGDVDADGFAEPIFLYESDGETLLVVWNHDAEITGQESTVAWSVSFPAKAFSAGDLDGDYRAELVLLEDGGWWGWADDQVHVLSVASEQIIASVSVSGRTIDVALGDRDSDDQAEIGVLRDGQQFELMELSGQLELTSLGVAPITVGNEATRISMVDWDGDSAFGRLIAGPELVAGEAVPVAALYFPPYPHKVAVGALSAKITVGEVESHSESLSDTLSLGVGLGISFGAETGIFKAKVGAKLSTSLKHTHKTTASYSVGARYSLHAKPDLYGTSYAGVIMSCGCYHRYRYEADDPAGFVGGSGQTVEIYVPVGGQI